MQFFFILMFVLVLGSSITLALKLIHLKNLYVLFYNFCIYFAIRMSCLFIKSFYIFLIYEIQKEITTEITIRSHCLNSKQFFRTIMKNSLILSKSAVFQDISNQTSQKNQNRTEKYSPFQVNRKNQAKDFIGMNEMNQQGNLTVKVRILTNQFSQDYYIFKLELPAQTTMTQLAEFLIQSEPVTIIRKRKPKQQSNEKTKQTKNLSLQSVFYFSGNKIQSSKTISQVISLAQRQNKKLDFIQMKFQWLPIEVNQIPTNNRNAIIAEQSCCIIM